jgi:solute carrier family 25 (mitochondrial citrate transporter), member 1
LFSSSFLLFLLRFFLYLVLLLSSLLSLSLSVSPFSLNMVKKTQSKSTAKNLFAGGMAGAIEATIMYPTEFVKTQLQLEKKTAKGGKPRYTGMLNCATVTVRERGFFSLYRGLSTLVIGSIPKAAVRFAAFQKFRSILQGNDPKLTQGKTMLAGLGAGVSEAILAVTPMETVKTKMIHDQNRPEGPRYRGLAHGVRTIIKEEGIGGVYRGLTPTMFKQGCNQMTRFTIFEGIKKVYLGRTGADSLAFYESLGFGSLAGFVSVYVTMPFDVVKTRMQGLEAKKYSGALNCGVRILKEEGVLALWKGTVPRLSRVMFSGGIIFAFYEQIMKSITPYWPEPEE